MGEDQRDEKYSDREHGATAMEPIDRAIVAHVAHGLSNREIGESVHLAEATVAHRLGRVMRRCGARNRAHLVAVVLTGDRWTASADGPR